VLAKWFGSLPFVMVLAIIVLAGSWLGYLMVLIFGSSSSTLVVGTFLGGCVGFSIMKCWDNQRNTFVSSRKDRQKFRNDHPFG